MISGEVKVRLKLLKPLSTNPTKWSNTLKQFVSLSSHCRPEQVFAQRERPKLRKGLWRKSFAQFQKRATENVLSKKVFIKISQSSQENTRVGVSF